jgi:hypothetical protein
MFSLKRHKDVDIKNYYSWWPGLRIEMLMVERLPGKYAPWRSNPNTTKAKKKKKKARKK